LPPRTERRLDRLSGERHVDYFRVKLDDAVLLTRRSFKYSAAGHKLDRDTCYQAVKARYLKKRIDII